jgi:hypothetical protein
MARHFDSNFTQGTEQIVSYDKVLGKLWDRSGQGEHGFC